MKYIAILAVSYLSPRHVARIFVDRSLEHLAAKRYDEAMVAAALVWSAG